ncbi:MAG TPA: peptidylprolyl isomerase [Vicinamibacterales bacterium]|nr:peptidylprolyl isomerase [Vicinamibacterales bacterium]
MLHALVLTWLFTVGGMPQAAVHVVVQTDLGEIEMEIDTIRAPVTSANFLRYVDAGLYNGGLFHRTVRPDNQREKPVKIAVIQGAANAARKSEFFPPIALERTNKTGLLHKNGTVSMARAGVDTATEEFFICVGDQPELDFGGKRNPDGQGFAAFGRVVRGIDIVRRIQESTAEGETLRPAIKIISIRRAGGRL